MKSTCPHCETTFRLDPSKIPNGGISARCSVCGGVFRVASEESPAAEEPASASVSPEPELSPAPAASPTVAEPAPTSAPTVAFGEVDPDAKARRLARALVSDIATYHPERRDRSLQAGTLRREFQEEIKKSWDEYVSQVGMEIARRTPHFRHALNDILARGSRIF